MGITACRILLKFLRRRFSLPIEHGWNGCDCCGHWVIGMVLSSLRLRIICHDTNRRRVSLHDGASIALDRSSDPKSSWSHREFELKTTFSRGKGHTADSVTAFTQPSTHGFIHNT